MEEGMKIEEIMCIDQRKIKVFHDIPLEKLAEEGYMPVGIPATITIFELHRNIIYLEGKLGVSDRRYDALVYYTVEPILPLKYLKRMVIALEKK